MITIRDALIEGIEELSYKLKLAYDSQSTGYDLSHPDALNIVGNKILRGGQPIALRGVSFAGYERNWQDVLTKYAQFKAEVALATKCNIIRLPVQSNVIDGGYGNYDAVKLFVDNIMTPVVEQITADGYYVIVDMHWIVDWDRVSVLKHTEFFWKTVAPKFKDNPRVLYEIFNEPMSPGRNELQTQQDFVKWFQPVVNMVRSLAPNNVIVMGNPDWTSNLKYAHLTPFVGSNIVHAFHVYPNLANTEAQGLSAWLQSEIHESLPVIMTEFGHSINANAHTDLSYNPQYKTEMEDFFRERPWIGWTAWNWDNESIPAMQLPHGEDLKAWVTTLVNSPVDFNPPAPLPDIASLSDVSGCVYAIDSAAPDALTVNSANKIASVSSSPSGNNAVQMTDNNKPTRSIVGPRYIMTFDGNDRLTLNGNMTSIDKVSFVVIARANSLDGTDRRLLTMNGVGSGLGAIQIFRKGTVGTIGASVSTRTSSSTQWPAMPTTLANNKWVCVILTIDGTTGRIGLRTSDSSVIVSAATSVSTPIFATGQTISIGDMVNGGAGWKGDIAEFAVINGVVSQKWCNKINEYVQKVYG